MSIVKIPSVEILEAINPTNSGTGEAVLLYDNLEPAVEKYRPTNVARSEKFWSSEDGSLDESSKAKQLAFEYFLRTAEKLVDSSADNRDLWADRFTQASIELYGAPDEKQVRQLVTKEYSELSQLRGVENVSQQHVNFLLDTYRPLVFGQTNNITYESEIERKKHSIHEYGQAILSKYTPLFDLVDESGKTEFNAQDLKILFKDALDWLIENDDDNWSTWSVIDIDGTSLSVDSSNRTIKIASRRECANRRDTRGLIAHELLVHALRGKNGYKSSNTQLATGLEGYLDAEEGLGILAEEAVNGELPEKAYDRYVDIALALGTIDGVQRTRKEIFEISFARQLLRGQTKGNLSESEIISLERRIWAHVDRIYRGGPGDEIGTRQAIFTKDIAYYVGYKQMADYISEQMDSGRKASEIFEYLSQAKFDPTNPQHAELLNKFT